MPRFLLSLIFMGATQLTIANAQIDNSDVLSVEAFLSVDKIRPGDTFKVGVRTTLHGSWHVNSHHPSEEFLIPTVVTFDPVNGLEFGDPNYPKSEEKKFDFSETPLAVYEGSMVIWATAKASESLKPGQIKITGNFGYQACNDVSCLMPSKEPFEILAEVVLPGTAVNTISEARFETSHFAMAELQGQRATADNEIGRLISGNGLLLTLVFIFIGGLALNLTPCVYPIIPITVSFFVGQASGKMSRSFLLAVVYVLGMAVTYSVLGVVAALTGGLLGSSLQSPIVLITIAGVFIVFAASMFGAFEIRVPTALNNLAGGSRQGIFGSLIMGLTVGIVAAPCIGPFVLSLLTYVAAQGDPVMGFLMFFILSMGLGLPYLILGTFSGSIQNLPRSGVWMVWVKKVFGVIMIAMAVYFLSTLLPETVYVSLLIATLGVGGLYVGFWENSVGISKWFGGLKKVTGVALVLVAGWLALSTWQQTNAPHIAWQPFDEAVFAQAKAEGKPVLIDFYADWCIPCKQLDRKLFSHPDVVRESKNFVAFKADLTKEDSGQVRKLRVRFKVVGVPTIILIDSNGNEYRRFTDELVGTPPADFTAVIREALPTNGS